MAGSTCRGLWDGRHCLSGSSPLDSLIQRAVYSGFGVIPLELSPGAHLSITRPLLFPTGGPEWAQKSSIWLVGEVPVPCQRARDTLWPDGRETKETVSPRNFPFPTSLRLETTRKQRRGFGSKYHVFLQHHKNARSNLQICMLTLEFVFGLCLIRGVGRETAAVAHTRTHVPA